MKKTLKTLLFTLIIATLSVFSSCSDKAPFNGVNSDLGLTVTGGGYDGTARLISSKITESINVKEVKAKLSGEQYNDTAELFIYYINVVKDGSSLLPTEAVSITLPIPTTDYGDFAVFHVTDTKVERLDFTLTETNISFSADSLSYFVIAHSHVHHYTDWTPVSDGTSHTRSCPCGYVATESHTYDAGEKSSDTVTTYTCQVCSYKYHHTHEYKTFTNTSDGLSHTKTCSCGNTVTEDHVFGEGVHSGSTTRYTCTLCGHDQIIHLVTLNLTVFPYNAAACSLTVNGNAYTEPVLLEYGQTVTLTVTPSEGYTFTSWDEKNELAKNTTFVFTVGDDDFTLGKSVIDIIVRLKEISGDGILLPIV